MAKWTKAHFRPSKAKPVVNAPARAAYQRTRRFGSNQLIRNSARNWMDSGAKKRAAEDEPISLPVQYR